MSNFDTFFTHLPGHQQAIRAKCIHPSGTFIAFKQEEIEQSIPARFEQQVLTNPDRIAIKTRYSTLTYSALNQEANRIARALVQSRGEGSEPLALLLDKDTPFFATMLGVLKAGKIYVPLDPAFPQPRLAAMLEDSQARLLITNTKNLALAKTITQGECEIYHIEEIDANLSPVNLGLTLSPDTLAAIFYTSGSTGQPKGVAHNHRNVLHAAMSHINSLHLCKEDRLSLLYSCSFSASTRVIFGAWFNGATLYPFDLQEDRVTHLASWLIQEEITIYQSVASVFRQFASNLTGEEKFPRLRAICVGSEPVTKRDVALYKAHFPAECVLVNTLAANETGSISQYFIDKTSSIPGDIVPVGYAAPDKGVLLLDETGQVVGKNQIGEIAVKSCYLAQGYWRKPELTQKVFRSDPASETRRIYLTGDLGRMASDGCLEHLGRKDWQVKMHGRWIELGKIEASLLALDCIKDAVVMVQEDQAGRQRLVAYLVPAKEPLPAPDTLRGFLQKTLPAFMIPSLFVPLETLPRTATGKVNRRTLPVPGTRRPELRTLYVAPQTPLEETLAAIWAEVLGLNPIGIHDHFLDVGGNSLLAMQIISRIIHTFRVDLPVRALFEAPTVADMAVIITQYQTHQQAGQEEMARMLTELEALSEEEVQSHLSTEGFSQTQGI